TFCLHISLPPPSPLFPYTTLFRSVVRNRDRPAHRGDVRRQVVVVIAGGDHRYRIAAAQEFFGEVPDVDLYATWNVPRVGTRDPDLHDDTGSARRGSSGSRSARNSR